MRAAARALVFDKALRLRNVDVSVGEVVTLSLNDGQRLLDMGMVRCRRTHCVRVFVETRLGALLVCAWRGRRGTACGAGVCVFMPRALCRAPCPIPRVPPFLMQYLVFSFLGPVAFIVVLGVLLKVVGVSILAGYAVMAVFVPIQRFLASLMGRVRLLCVCVCCGHSLLLGWVWEGAR
jgi:hypothetical protein